MKEVSILEAKTNLSGLVRTIESGREDCIVISRNGRPVAKLVLYSDTPVSKRIGAAKGRFVVPDDFDKYGSEVAALMGGPI